MSEPTSKPLAIPRTGCQRLTNGGLTKECITFAAWQSPEDKTPKRVVVRVDGLINDVKDEDGVLGFPCGVVKVTYNIGGLVKSVLLDCATQSALVVWANSVEVEAYRDTERIAALALYSPNLKPCANQTVAAAISACECGDTGMADARYLSAVPIDPNAEGAQNFVLPVPAGARLVRFLPGARVTDEGGISEVPWASIVIFAIAADPVTAAVVGIIETHVPLSNVTAYTIPADARVLAFSILESEEVADMVQIPFVEWIMGPASLTVQTP